MQFSTVTNTTFTPNVYKVAHKKWLSWNLSITLEILKFYNNSALFRQQVIDRQTRKCLATMDAKIVFAYRKTRRPNGLPKWITALNIGSDIPSNTSMMYKPSVDIPTNVFRYRYTIMPSDVDINIHTNNITYIRLCIDVAALACKSNHFTYFRNTIYNYDTKTHVAYFARETAMLNEVEIVVWQDDVNELKLHFIIYHKGTPVYYQDTEFYNNTYAILAKY